MKTVYAVLKRNPDRGDEPDVFSTREKAEAFLGDGGDEFRIVELELDPRDTGVVRLYRVVMEFDGDAERVVRGYAAGYAVRTRGAAVADCNRRGEIEAESTVSVEHAIETAKTYAAKAKWWEEKMRKYPAARDALRASGASE